MLWPGALAWVTTLLLPVSAREVGLLPRALAAMALGALLAGPLLALSWPTLGRRVGIWGVLAAALGAWAALDQGLEPARLEPLRAAAGSVGWALYALGWGSPRALGQIPEEDPRALRDAPLAPRQRSGRLAGALYALAVAASVGWVGVAWHVERLSSALLAQASALLAGVAVLLVGPAVALGVGRARPMPSPGTRLSHALPSFGVVALLLVAGAIWVLMG